MHIKFMMRYHHYTPNELVKILKSDNVKYWAGYGVLETHTLQ